MATPAVNIESLNVEERLELIENLWASLRSEPDAIPVTEAQKQMLDERLDAIEAGDDAGAPWNEVIERIRKGLK